MRNDNSARSLFVMSDDGNLSLSGIELDGMSETATPAKYLIRTEFDPMSKSYKLNADDCYFQDVGFDGNGNFGGFTSAKVRC